MLEPETSLRAVQLPARHPKIEQNSCHLMVVMDTSCSYGRVHLAKIASDKAYLLVAGESFLI